jgi:serine/threonine protein kinase
MIPEEAISENYIKTKEILGRGKYGNIYLGYNKSTHQEVAIKEGLKDAKLGHERKVYNNCSQKLRL